MTNYTTPIIKEENYDHKEKQKAYETQRKEYTANLYQTRNDEAKQVAAFNGA